MAIDFSQERILPVRVDEEMKRSYIDYAMSVIVDRALPDVRDGLKPVQRRILYGMYELGLRPDRQHRKSARIVGDVMGKYHPHGDAAIYDAMVRMAQDFNFRYPLVDGHGNFGSVDGDPPAAMRYTEARLSQLAMEMLRDIDKDTVDFVPNFDDTLEQPAVLPARIPNLLINGASGIAVGMATNIPPHNLREIVDGLVLLIDNPDADLKDLMKVVKGPDFPTGAMILGRDGIKEAYTTGRGRIKVRAKARIEELANGRQRIVVTEIPYLVNKSSLIQKIAELHRNKQVDGITDLRDESDRTGMRIVIELRRDANARVVLNRLYRHTQMEDTFGVIMLALVDGEPKVLNLKEALQHYLKHQEEVVIRRTRFELQRAEERAHILEGLRIALDHIDEIIALIRRSKTDNEAKQGLMQRFGLTEKQAVAILDMQLRRLTGLEREKIEAEYQELLKTIARLREILGDIRKVYEVIKQELLEIKEKYGDERRTQITSAAAELAEEDLIADEDVVVTVTHFGYIKRLPLTAYRSQRRGGRGITAISTREEDFVEQLFVTSTHSYILFFSDKGKVYRIKAHEVPEVGRTARGTAIVNLIQLPRDERIKTAIPIREYDEGHYLFMATKRGIVKKTVLTEFDSPRHGLIGILLDEDDELVDVRLTEGNEHVLLVTAHGQAIRFPENDVRPMGRAARGVRGITLEEGDSVVGLDVVRPAADLLVVSQKGFGKRTPLEEYRVTGRGGKGIRTLQITEKNGPIVAVRVVRDGDEVMLISAAGIMIRTSVDEISRQGRATQGVRVMRLDAGDYAVAAALVADKDDDKGEQGQLL
ncbi:MAG: DNA gyrase subunit A [Firmicutes bacterium ZCTH02-B6]|nr:MAG: DNA gyrase subunit A [Firmicutes bacterium ZCTH02-B6]